MEHHYREIISNKLLISSIAYYFCEINGLNSIPINKPDQGQIKNLQNIGVIDHHLNILDLPLGYACYEYHRQSASKSYLDKILLSKAIKKKVIVDLCCGPGATIQELLKEKPEKIYAIDESYTNLSFIDFIEQNENRTIINKIYRNANSIPYEMENVDYVICRVSLQYLEVKKVLAEIYRILNKCGSFYAIVHGSGYPLDFIWRRKMLFKSKNQIPAIQKERLGLLKRAKFLSKQSLIKEMSRLGFKNIEIFEEQEDNIFGIFPVYFGIFGEK
ncbi:class I SAM-dependent methyltransferase [Metabacillus sp. KIGAM252]|uniref:Class I SAM-dependent methyltransferase n=1 Tax=Metabacillus flavus TaxID=2823519 RepID=A0ABS5LGD7_9BACI|nr:class I SAM-dependent methyltransferase [Metabacillus flavus]MBS2969644.1 class I SAM-dependent methyltransferase [Metabacillus flavus]